jgi:hypothetical protein
VLSSWYWWSKYNLGWLVRYLNPHESDKDNWKYQKKGWHAFSIWYLFASWYLICSPAYQVLSCMIQRLKARICSSSHRERKAVLYIELSIELENVTETSATGEKLLTVHVGVAMWASSGWNRPWSHSLSYPVRFTWQSPGGNPSWPKHYGSLTVGVLVFEAVVPGVFTDRQQILHDGRVCWTQPNGAWFGGCNMFNALPYLELTHVKEASWMMGDLMGSSLWWIPKALGISTCWLASMIICHGDL